MTTGSIQLGNLTRLAKEDQWRLWIQDLRDIMFLNGLHEYFDNEVPEPQADATDKQKSEWKVKHETVRAIIHSALSPDIRDRMEHHGYNREIHRGRQIVDLAEKSVKLISGNMDTLYYDMWNNLRRTDFKSWTAFIAEYRRLYGKLRETGQEVTAKSACIHLFNRVRM
jgi:hypothetical protein